MRDAPSDVLIVGGGPAGCAAAILLARWGHRVQILTKSPVASAPLGESIPPSTRRLFETLGVREAVDAAGFVRSSGNTVWWGGRDARLESFPAGARGWQVTRGALERILQQYAAAAGAQLAASRATTEALETSRATFVLDCTGRAGLWARAHRLREYDSRFRTVAMVGLWHHDSGFEVPERTHTLIESYDGGWAWSVPHSTGERFIAAMIDPRRSDLSRETSSAVTYLRELGKTAHLSRVTRDATLVRGPVGWDASMYRTRRYVDGRVLLVGDAGAFIDPLSSAGIKKALASGWLAAVAVNTSLRRPAMRSTALDFYAAREAEVYASFLSMTEEFFAQAASGHAHRFWSDPPDELPRPDLDGDAQAAFAQLRGADRLRVGRAPGLRVEPRPAVSGTEIVLEHRIVSGQADPGARFAFDVDLIGLIDLAPAHTSVPDLFEVYVRHNAPVALPDFLAALSTAIARKWLVWL